jgi:plasmid stability protein
MEKTRIRLPKDELDRLRKVAARSGRSVSDIVREAIRKAPPKAPLSGPVAIWGGKPRRTSLEHDDSHDDV